MMFLTVFGESVARSSPRNTAGRGLGSRMVAIRSSMPQMVGRSFMYLLIVLMAGTSLAWGIDAIHSEGKLQG